MMYKPKDILTLKLIEDCWCVDTYSSFQEQVLYVSNNDITNQHYVNLISKILNKQNFMYRIFLKECRRAGLNV